MKYTSMISDCFFVKNTGLEDEFFPGSLCWQPVVVKKSPHTPPSLTTLLKAYVFISWSHVSSII